MLHALTSFDIKTFRPFFTDIYYIDIKPDEAQPGLVLLAACLGGLHSEIQPSKTVLASWAYYIVRMMLHD